MTIPRIRPGRKATNVVLDLRPMAILQEAYPDLKQSELIRMAVRHLADLLQPPTAKPTVKQPRRAADEVDAA